MDAPSTVPAAYAVYLPVALAMTQIPTSQAQKAISIYQYCAANFKDDVWASVHDDVDKDDRFLDLAAQLCTHAARQDIQGIYSAMKDIDHWAQTVTQSRQQIDDVPAGFVIQTPSLTTRRTSTQIQQTFDPSRVIPLQFYTTYASLWNGVEASGVKKLLKRNLKILVGQQEDYWTRWSTASWADANELIRDHIESLRLYTVPHQDSLPDMMTYCLGELHKLDPSIEDRLHQLLSMGNNWYIKNASGTGKTRLVLEALTREWGLYFPCFWDEELDPYGSRDLFKAVEMLKEENRNSELGHAFFDPLDDLRPRDRTVSQIRLTNHMIASHLFSIVLLARVVVLETFLQSWDAYGSANSLSNEQRSSIGKNLWCHLQIDPRLGCSDIFYEVFRTLLLVSEKDAVTTIRRTLLRVENTYSWFNLKIIAFDEAQHASNLFPLAFPSDNSPETSRPVLRPIIIAITKAVPKSFSLIVCGTKLGEAMITDALTTALGKSKQKLNPFQELGDQSESSRQLNAEIEWWLPGRHRFMSLLIQHTLRAGPTKLETVLNTLIYQLTGHKRQLDFEPLIGMNLNGVLSRSLYEKVLSSEIQVVIEAIQRIVISLVVGEGFPSLPEEYLDLVIYGIGRIVAPNTPGEPIMVDEPIILAALVQWIMERQDCNPFIQSVSANLDPQRPDSSKGALFEDMIAFQLWRSFCQPTRLSDIFDFRYLKPSWAEETAELLSCMSSFTTTGFWATMGPIMTSRLLFKSYNPKDSLGWFDNQDVFRQPFLKPDIQMGPDLVFGLRLQSGKEILVVIHCKCWQGQQKDGPKEVEHAIWQLSPENCYVHESYTDQSDNFKARLGTAFHSHSVDMPTRPTSSQKGEQDSGGSIAPPALSEQPDQKPGVKEWVYEAGSSKYPVLRVFAAFKGSHGMPEKDDLGPYPLAYLTEKFMEYASIDFPSFKVAINHAKQMGYPKRKANKVNTHPKHDKSSDEHDTKPSGSETRRNDRKRTSSARSDFSVSLKARQEEKRTKHG